MLINSVKELAEKNKNKDAKIDELQKQIDELKALMQQLLNTKSTAPCLPLANK